MRQIEHQAKDGRRISRRPSLWFVTILVGLTLLGAALTWIRQSPPNSVSVHAIAPDDQFKFAEENDEESVLLVTTFNETRSDFIPASRDPLIDQLFKTLSGIQREANPALQSAMLEGFVTNLSFADMMTVLGQLQGCSNRMELQLSAQLTRRWAETDPKAAATWAASLPEGGFRSLVLDQAAGAWAEGNWADAAEWARQVTDEGAREQVMRFIAGELVRSDPMEALRLAVDLSPTQTRDELIRRAAMEWATSDAPNAAQWAMGISDPALRAQVLASISMAWSDQDVQAAATLAVNGLPAGRSQSDALVGIASRWAQVDPEAAAAWVSRYPAGAAKKDAREAVVAIWLLIDADAAAKWRDQTAKSEAF